MQNTELAIKQECPRAYVEDGSGKTFIEGRKKGLRDIDPRIKILMSLAFSSMLFFTAQKVTVLLSLLVAFAILLFSGQGRFGVKCLFVYALCLFVDFLTTLAGAEILRVLLGVFVYSIMKFIPIIMLGSWLVATVKVNDFIAAMEKMGISRAVVIPLAVLVRFLPTVKEELGYIQDTMRMRNIEISFAAVLFHPIRTMEYILVPLLLRSVKVSDELSAAALTRGIDGENKRTTLREVRISLFDVMIASLFVVFIIEIWYLDKNVFAGLALGRLWP